MRRGLHAWGATMLVALVAGAVLTAPPAIGAVPRQPVIEGLFDVGGYRLYLRCTGRGSPTVIMDASLGADSTTWAPIEATLARYTRVCVYDRAGLGRSDPGPVPRTSQTMVDDLLTLLRVAGVPGPYVLVGHSLGGLNMQLLARQAGAGTVVGVVLVDATPAEFPTVVAEAGFPVPSPEENPEGVDLVRSGAEVLAAPPFPPVPLVVLTHGAAILPPPLEAAWQQLQAAQAAFSPRGRLVVARGSGHFIHEDDPRLVIRTIVQVVNEARRTSRQRAA